MGATLIILLGLFLAWCSVSIIQRGYFVGRVVFGRPLQNKRYYRAGHPIQFWSLAGGGLVMAVVLLTCALSHLCRG
jgi:putative solute:sodium symporter small subunit